MQLVAQKDVRLTTKNAENAVSRAERCSTNRKKQPEMQLVAQKNVRLTTKTAENAVSRAEKCQTNDKKLRKRC